MAITATTLKHPQVLTQLQQALVDTAIHKYPVQHITNRKGHAFLAVRYRPHSARARGRAFWCLDNAGNDVTESVYKALRASAL